jgi:hypothetical protein
VQGGGPGARAQAFIRRADSTREELPSEPTSKRPDRSPSLSIPRLGPIGAPPLVPLDGTCERGRTQVRAADEGRAPLGVAKDVRLWVERSNRHRLNIVEALGCCGLEHPPLDGALQVEQAHQGSRFGDPQIIASENAQFATPYEEISKVLKHAIDAALKREAHDNIGRIRDREFRDNVRE